MSLRQLDIAHVSGLHVMSVSRAAMRFGRHMQPMDEETGLLILVAAALRDRGLSFVRATNLVAHHAREIQQVAADPSNRQLWIVLVDKPAPHDLAMVTATSATSTLR